MTFVRYIIVQLLAYGIDMGMFLIVIYTGSGGPIGANVVAKCGAGIFAFVTHRYFTFRAAKGSVAKGQAIRYFVLLALNIPLTSAILALLLMWISDPVIAKFIADVIGVGLTYFLSKHFVFTSQKKRSRKAGSAGAAV